MNKKKPEDKLENLFGELFNNPDKVGKKDGWNVPSADVWNNIQAGLQGEKKPRRIVGYWHWVAAAASFLLLISLFQLYQYNQKINQLSNQLEINGKAVDIIKSDLEALTYQEEKKEQSILENNAPNPDTKMKEKKEGVPTMIKPPSLKDSSNKIAATKKTKIINKATNYLIEKQQSKFNPPLFSDEIHSRNQEQDAPNLANKSLENKSENLQKNEIPINAATKIGEEKNIVDISISNLPTLLNLLKIKDKVINPTFNPVSAIIKNKPSFYLATDYAPIWEVGKVQSGRFGGMGPFSGSEQQERSFTTGLQFGVHLGKGWIVETGLRYTNSNKSAQHTGSIPYRFLTEELNNQGTYESTLNLQLGSSSGTVETEVVLSRSSATVVDEQTDLNLNIAFSKSVTSLDIPLLVKRQWAIGNFGLTVRAGLLNRFIIENNFEVSNIALDDTRFQSRLETVRERGGRSESAAYSPHFVAGLGIEYHIQPKWSVYVEPTFTRSIQPIANLGLRDIHTEGKMVNLGFRYQL